MSRPSLRDATASQPNPVCDRCGERPGAILESYPSGPMVCRRCYYGHDGGDWRPAANSPSDDRKSEAEEPGDSLALIDYSLRLKAGGRFVLDDPATLDAVWGEGDRVLWPDGEPLLIVGPTGVGKTTLAILLVAGLLGLVDQVLGFPVVDDGRRVLYLAMDRPRQIRRAMRRLFGDIDRDILNDRLAVWEGPLPFDLGRRPETVLEMARAANADVVMVDSLKDAAVKLTDDEAGGTLNRALQLLVADGRNVASLHHQRKGTNGAKPNTLEDVYGSTWITAGAGSVVLLWGAAGDPLVTLSHLKQPASEIGPMQIEHEQTTGTMSVYRGTADPLVILQHAASGLTAGDLARLMFEVDKPNDNQRKKAQRQLDRLVTAGLGHKTGFSRGGEGGSTDARYYAVTDRESETESQ